jgi:hypothetical protein
MIEETCAGENTELKAKAVDKKPKSSKKKD